MTRPTVRSHHVETGSLRGAPMRRPRSDEDGPHHGRLISAWTTAAGKRWHARSSVDPPDRSAMPVVLVHGLGSSSRIMEPTSRLLAPSVPTYAPDLPGFGKSELPRRPLDVAELADALVAWMEAVGLDGVCLVGHSFGCQVAVEAAVRFPHLVRRMILVDPSGDPAARSLPRMFARLLRDVPREPPALIRLQAGDAVAAGPRVIFATARAMVRDPVATKLAQVQQEVLVVMGERDPIVPIRWAAAAACRLPRGRLLVLPGAAHAVPYTAPRALAAAVRDFLADDGSA